MITHKQNLHIKNEVELLGNKIQGINIELILEGLIDVDLTRIQELKREEETIKKTVNELLSQFAGEGSSSFTTIESKKEEHTVNERSVELDTSVIIEKEIH